MKAITDCRSCTQGHYCELATVNPEQCIEGTYMPWGATAATADGPSPVIIGPGTIQLVIKTKEI